MEGLNKWIVIMAALLIGVFLGMVLNETIDLFGLIGLGSRSALRRERVELERIHAERVDLLEKNFSEYREGARADQRVILAELESKRKETEALEAENRILRSGEAASGRASEKVGEGLQSVERLERLVEQLDE